MFLEQTINGLAVGSVYALVAVGYSLIFGVLRILNLAHASFYAFTGNIMLVMIGGARHSYWIVKNLFCFCVKGRSFQGVNVSEL